MPYDIFLEFFYVKKVIKFFDNFFLIFLFLIKVVLKFFLNDILIIILRASINMT